jgi:hypothetical protein
MGTNERFDVRESAALLHAIYPGYPDLRGMKPAPEAGAFLLALRSPAGEQDQSCPRTHDSPPGDRERN